MTENALADVLLESTTETVTLTLTVNEKGKETETLTLTLRWICFYSSQIFSSPLHHFLLTAYLSLLHGRQQFQLVT